MARISMNPSHNHQSHAHGNHSGHSPAIFKQKFWLSFLLTIPTLIFSHSVQSWFGLHLTFVGSDYIPALCGTILFMYGGTVFLKSAKNEFARRQPGMMTLVSMAISVAFVYSLLITCQIINGMDFWWELTTLITIMLLGHWLEMTSIQSVQGALNELAKLLPNEAEVLVGNSIKKTPTNQLKTNDLLLIRPGAQIPVDGIVVKGLSKVNESLLTGESKPVTKDVDSKVIGGTINLNGTLTICATGVGKNTTLAGIIRLVQEAQTSKSYIQTLADRAAFYLTCIALIAALVTWVTWLLAGKSAEFILERVVTVLITACPHALGLAIPLVTSISTTMAAKNGLLVRQRRALEMARTVDTILFDKTGTLTKGRQGIDDVITTDRERTLNLAAALEGPSEHPIAQAINLYARNQNLPNIAITDFLTLPGRGIQANVDGKLVYIGGPQLLKKLGLKPGSALQKVSKDAFAAGKTIVYVIENQKILGAITLTDTIREESKEAIESLKSMGKRVAILTGDNEGVAAWTAKALGIEKYFANIPPNDKAKIVKQLQASGNRVAVVGDGVNDAPALAQADVSIAIGAGTNVAIETADIILASSDPRGVTKAILLSKATYNKMIQNLIWATGYNLFAIPLAMGIVPMFGFVLSPALGAITMSLSTIVVAINAQSLRKIHL